MPNWVPDMDVTDIKGLINAKRARKQIKTYREAVAKGVLTSNLGLVLGPSVGASLCPSKGKCSRIHKAASIRFMYTVHPSLARRGMTAMDGGNAKIFLEKIW
jgi:hypothetical protein